MTRDHAPDDDVLFEPAPRGGHVRSVPSAPAAPSTSRLDRNGRNALPNAWRQCVAFRRLPAFGGAELAHFTQDTAPSPPLIQDRSLILFPSRGAVEVRISAGWQLADPGHIAIVPAHRGYALRLAHGATSYFALSIDQTLLAPLPGLTFPGHVIIDGILARRFRRALHGLANMPDDAAALAELFDAMERLRAVHHCPCHDQRHPGGQEVARRMRRYMLERLPRQISSLEIAEAFGLSRPAVSRVLVRAFGLSLRRYLPLLRIGRLQQFLRLGMSFGDAIAATGLTSESLMTRQFLRFVGIPPREFARGTLDSASAPADLENEIRP